MNYFAELANGKPKAAKAKPKAATRAKVKAAKPKPKKKVVRNYGRIRAAYGGA
jgi:hypothetical protein